MSPSWGHYGKVTTDWVSHKQDTFISHGSWGGRSTIQAWQAGYLLRDTFWFTEGVSSRGPHTEEGEELWVPLIRALSHS